MAKGLTPQQISDKQVKNSLAAVENLKQGAMNVKVAPNSLAAKAVNKYLANVQASVDNGNYAAGNNSVTLQAWQDAMTTKGAKNYPTGITYAKPKIEAFHQAFDPYRDSVAAQVNQMPNDTEAERDQKMLENARRLRQFNYRKKRVG